MKRIFMLIILSVLAVVVVACGAKEEDSNKESNNEAEEKVTIDHELGETEVSLNPEKVVVFDYGSLDSLDKLGIEVTGIPQGNMPSYLSDYDSDTYENVGSLKEPDFEKIAEIDPDLIVISGRQSAQYDELSKLGPTIYLGVDTERYMDSFKENLDIIAEIFDKESEVEAEWKEIESSIDELHTKATEANKNALIILANDNKISAYGPNSRFGIIHDVFGVPAVDNDIEASTHGNDVGFEYVAKEDPDLLYVVDRGAVVNGESSAQIVVENKLMEDTKAFQNDNIFYLDPDYWYLSGGGLESVSAMIQEITESLGEEE